MSKKELRDLDAWIDIHVLGCIVKTGNVHLPRNYTTDPAAALDVLKKCAEVCELSIMKTSQTYWIEHRARPEITAHGQSLELCVCEFARRIFA